MYIEIANQTKLSCQRRSLHGRCVYRHVPGFSLPKKTRGAPWLTKEIRRSLTKSEAIFTFSNEAWQHLSVDKVFSEMNPSKRFTHHPTVVGTGYVHLCRSPVPSLDISELLPHLLNQQTRSNRYKPFLHLHLLK